MATTIDFEIKMRAIISLFLLEQAQRVHLFSIHCHSGGIKTAKEGALFLYRYSRRI